MLRDLHISNLAVFSEASVEFERGFNVLTGETGAGKSIVVDSLALLAGARAQTDLIRTGADMLRVTGIFTTEPACLAVLEKAGISTDDELVIRREVHRSGRNRVYVNDQPVTLKLLTELAPHLLRIHGQREELGLAHPQLQKTWLDRQGGDGAEKLLARCRSTYETYDNLAKRLHTVTGDRRLRDERIDLFTYQANEIDTADLTAGEEVALRQDREVLRNAETISATLGDLSRSLFDEDGAAAERLGTATSRLTEIEHWEPQASTWKEELDEIRVRLEEVVASLRQRADRVEPDPPRLQAVEDRLALIERLCRKYGDTTTKVLAYRDTIGAELEELRGDDEQQHDLAAQTSEALATYREVAQALSERRRKWAGSLIQDLQRELEELSMPAARFEVVLDPRPRAGSPLEIDGEGVEFGPAGFDQVGFLFSPNPGEELHPLSRVASGGELSRVYLALQLLAQGNSAPTLVFDEVDSGVGGVEAVALGRKLKKLAESGQILTVTHLPQVASQGDEHFRVAKEIRGGRTFVSVLGLGREERVDEISRMLGDQEAGTASRNHAEALLAQGSAAEPARR